MALRRGLQLGRVVFVSAPSSIKEHARNFARLLGITPLIREAMRLRIEQRYGVRFDDIDRVDELEQLRLPALFVHDSGDAEVPFDHALRLSGRVPGARTIKKKRVVKKGAPDFTAEREMRGLRVPKKRLIAK